MKKSIIISLIYSLLSCTTLVDDIPLSRFPDIRAKLVMSAFIAPNDTAIVVNLTESTPLFGSFKTNNDGPFYITPLGDTIYYDYNRNDIVKNAIVKISDGNKTINIPFDSNKNNYSIETRNFKIEAGQTYTLTAENNIGKVEATTKVPFEEIQINNFKIDTTNKLIDIFEEDSITKRYSQKKINTKGYKIQYNWQDVFNIKNYYYLKGYLEYFQETPQITNNKDVIYIKSKIQTRIQWSNLYYDTKAFLDDFNKNGENIIGPVGEIYEISQFGGFNISINGKNYKAKPIEKDNRKMILQLYNLSKEFYAYQISLYKSIDGNDNPFAEPSPVFTNVKNGLGCFAGYTKTEVMVDLK